METATCTPAHAPSRRARLVALATSCVLAAGLSAVSTAGSAEAAASVPVGTCTLPSAPALEAMTAARRSNPVLVVGAQDMAWARDVERRSSPVTSSREGLQTRQQLRFADAALTAALPARTELSKGARASTDRMLLLRYAMEVAADGTTPALKPGTALTSPDTYAARIRREVLAWVAMPTWGSAAPIRTKEDSLLETAEVASVVALGYSLVPSAFSSAERSAIRSALVGKALAPACWAYANGSWMVDSTSNWGVVVNAGMSLAALVVADHDDAAAGAVLAQALPRLRRAVATTAADGGSPEGPNYASLMHRYLAYLSASMDLTYGDAGRKLVPVVPNAARYVVAVTGPSSETFDYADADGAYVRPYLALYNARHGGDPLGDWIGQRLLDQHKVDTLLLLWSRPVTRTPASEPTATTFRTSGVATLRSSWDGPATWVGVRGGEQVAGHRHLDLGSFVLEVDGRRFVDEYGQDNYSLPAYTGAADPYSLWRLRTDGHSTLMRRGVQQSATALAPLSAPSSSGDRRAVTVDMRQALGAMAATRVLRVEGRQVTVDDRVRFRGSTALRWSAQTQASVTLHRAGRSALLTVDGRTVEARLATSTPGAFRVTPAPEAPPGGRSNAGWKTLSVDVGTHPASSGTSAAAVVVTFIPR